MTLTDRVQVNQEESVTSESLRISSSSAGPRFPLDSLLAELKSKTNVTSLTLVNCQLSALPEDIGSLHHLTHINLSQNSLIALPVSLKKLKKVVHFDGSHNVFNTVPACLYHGMPILKYLDLSYNQIKNFNHPPECIYFLRTLKLSNNSLNTLPLWILENSPGSLQEMDLSSNPCFDEPYNIEYVDTSCEQIVETVTHLNISNCCIYQRDLSFIRLFKNLSHLEIGNAYSKVRFRNLIQDLPFEELKHAPLRKLVAPSLGPLGDLEKVGQLKMLTFLDLSYNTISWFPNSIGELKQLQTLIASYCNMCVLPSTVGSLTSLKTLILSFNMISHLPESFSNLTNLESLDLHSNQLSNMCDLSNLSRLRALDVCQNVFEPPEIFTIAKKTVPYQALKSELKLLFDDLGISTNMRPSGPLAEHESTSYSCSASESVYEDEEELKSLASEPSQGVVEQCVASSPELWTDEFDDNFNPNDVVLDSLAPLASDESGDIVPRYLSCNEHYYRPTSVRRVPLYRPNFKVVEGQFDDA